MRWRRAGPSPDASAAEVADSFDQLVDGITQRIAAMRQEVGA